jgi:hypothetical protein
MTNQFERLVMCFAGAIDDAMIWYYLWRGVCDCPCGKLQTWARIKRKGDGMEATLKAKKKLGT